MKITKHKPNLASRIKNKFSAQLKGKNVKIINFSLGAYKQPQQYISASLYLEAYDLAINVEGYNEFSKASAKDYPVYYPAYSNIFFSDGTDKLKYLSSLVEKRKSQVQATHFILENPYLRGSPFAYLFWRAFIKRDYLKLKEHQIKFQAQRLKKHSFYQKALTGNSLIKEQFMIWRKYTILQHKLLSAFNRPVYFFIQPYQYIEKSKPLSDQEKLQFYFPNEETEHAKIGFNMVLNSLVELRKIGISVYDLTCIFSKERRTTYKDRCCHLNSLGNNLLEEAIFEIISREIEKRGLSHLDREIICN